MPNWLAKAKAAFQPPEPAPPEPFRLVCVCGAVVNGMRREHEQRVRCDQCQHEMFVLPESVYPPPAARSRRQMEVIEEDVEVIDESESSSDTLPRGPADAISLPQSKPGSQPAGKRKSRRGRKRDQTSAAAQTAQPDSAEEVEVDGIRGIRDRRRWRIKIYTPFRAIVAGIALALLLTGYLVVHSRSVANAEGVRTTSGKLGQEGVDKGDLGTAVQEFTKVEKALKILEVDDPQSRQLHQLFLEVRAAADLAPTSVPDMVSEAVDGSSSTSITPWKDSFKLTYRDKWMVIDTTIDDGDPESDVRLSVPLMLDDERAEFVIDRKWFAEQMAEGGKRRVIFGGRLESCRSTGSTTRTWEIRFADESLFLWADPRTYELIGFPLDDESGQVLQQQSEMLGVSK